MNNILIFSQGALVYVYNTLIHNALFLLLGIAIAAVITVHVDPEKFKDVLLRRSNISIAGSVAFGAFTPFCACGTMAVVVAMMATALPWGPVMAFLTSSPLMSPDEFVMIAGILGTKFAIALTVASIIIGVGSGYITHLIEKRTNYLVNQARLAPAVPTNTCCELPVGEQIMACCAKSEPSPACGTSCFFPATVPKIINNPFLKKLKLGQMFQVFIDVGLKNVLVNFAAFAAVAYVINKFVPTAFIAQYLGTGNQFAVPLSALVGLPLYVSGESSLPLINMLMKSGATSGAMLAFMITGPGTSAGVIAGIATIMKKRAVGLYVLFLLVFSIILGYGYDLLIALGL